MSLSEALPTPAFDTVGVYTTKCYRQLRVKDLPKISSWRLVWYSNPPPSAPKALTPTTCHHTPQRYCGVLVAYVFLCTGPFFCIQKHYIPACYFQVPIVWNQHFHMNPLESRHDFYSPDSAYMKCLVCVDSSFSFIHKTMTISPEKHPSVYLYMYVYLYI